MSPYISDSKIPVRRLRLNPAGGGLVAAPNKPKFLKGPIRLDWLTAASALPGKSLNVALALCWLDGMAGRKPFKLTKAALDALNVAKDAASDGLARLEQRGLVQVERRAGRRPVITLLFCAQHSPT